MTITRKYFRAVEFYFRNFKNMYPLLLVLTIYLLLKMKIYKIYKNIFNILNYKILKLKLKNGKYLNLHVVSLWHLLFYGQRNPNLKIDLDNKYMYLDSDRIPLEELKWGIEAHFKAWKYVGDHWELEYGKFNVKFKRMISSIYEVFNDEIYESDFKDKEVVDIGANVGDSAIWFALNGAKKVVAIEPLVDAYNEAKYNIQLNGLQDKIFLINAAISYDKPKVLVPNEIDIYESAHFNLKKNCNEKQINMTEVETLKLSDILKLCSEPWLLKMDCEGCEYDVIRNDLQGLSKFKYVIFEFHFPDKIREILSILDKKFNCHIREKGKSSALIFCEKKPN
jgi:FkbM family methyltransferase